jgi:hypothetical protein
MNRRGFFTRIAAAALAGVVIPREAAAPPWSGIDWASEESVTIISHLSRGSIHEQYARGHMNNSGFVWYYDGGHLFGSNGVTVAPPAFFFEPSLK